MTIKAHRVTREDMEQGHVPCDCGRYTHVTGTEIVRRLPRDYSGELCAECGLWMCAVDRLPTNDGGRASA